MARVIKKLLSIVEIKDNIYYTTWQVQMVLCNHLYPLRDLWT